MKVREKTIRTPEHPEGPSPIWDKHQAAGRTRCYQDLIHVDIDVWVGSPKPGIRFLCKEHERGHARTLADVVEGLSFEEAYELVPNLGPSWENECEAWMRSNARVRTLHGVEFVLDCLNSYRRSLGVSDEDWSLMREELEPLVLGAREEVRMHWWRYEPPEQDGGGEGAEGFAPGEPSGEGDYRDLSEYDEGPGDDEIDERSGEPNEPDSDGKRAPGRIPEAERDGWRGWLEPEVLRRVIAGENIAALAKELLLPLENLPPIVAAYRKEQ